MYAAVKFTYNIW